MEILEIWFLSTSVWVCEKAERMFLGGDPPQRSHMLPHMGWPAMNVDYNKQRQQEYRMSR